MPKTSFPHWNREMRGNFKAWGDPYKCVSTDQNFPVQIAAPLPAVAVPALPPPIVPPPPPPPAPLLPWIDPDLDTEEEDAAVISLPTDTDFDFTTASEDEADATVVERDAAKTPTNEPRPRVVQEGIYAEIDPFATSSRLRRSPPPQPHHQGARPKGILRQPFSSLLPGPPPRPIRFPPQIEAAAFNPFASSSQVQRSPPLLTTEEAARLPKEFRPTPTERHTQSTGRTLNDSILHKYIPSRKKK